MAILKEDQKIVDAELLSAILKHENAKLVQILHLFFQIQGRLL